MATYEEIYGKRVKDFDSDPTLDSSYEGQVWYDSATGKLKSVVALEAFTSSASMGTGRYQAMWAGEGTQNATLSCSGRTAAPAIVTNTEEYNGSGWTVGGACNNAENSCAGFGTQTAAIKTGGYPGSDPEGLATESESYNGTSWTAGNAISPGRQGHAGAGVSTAGVIFGGNDGTVLNKTEEFNGTNFSNVNNMNTARQNLSGVGIQTAALAAGGGTTPVTTAAEVYDGTNWTTVGSMNTARQGMGSFGTSTSAAVTGGSTGSNSTATETWDGTSWTTSPATLATARAFYGDCGAGSSTAGIVAGGYSTATIGNTEEYNKSINTFTAAAFSSMGAMGTSRYGHSAAGDKTAAVVVSGRPTGPSPTTNVEEYNGSSWSEVTNVPSGKFYAGGGMGTQTASIFAGGYGSPPEGVQSTVESYDGTNWTDVPSLNTAKFSACPAGTQTAGLLAGGSPSNNTSEEWNGSSWTEGNNLTESFDDITGAGTQTAAIAMGGSSPGTFAETDSELYDGTNWTNGPTMSTGRRRASGAGTQTDALVLAGLVPGPAATTAVEGFDGTAFSTRPSLGTSRYYGYGFSATSGNAYIAGGLTSPGAPNHTTAAEEFTGETETITAKTLTTS